MYFGTGTFSFSRKIIIESERTDKWMVENMDEDGKTSWCHQPAWWPETEMDGPLMKSKQYFERNGMLCDQSERSFDEPQFDFQ